MNVTYLRHIIKRRGNAGVAMVGVYLTARYLWSRYRTAAAALVLILGGTLCGEPHKHVTRTRPVAPPPTKAIEAPPEEDADVVSAQVTLPYPHKLLISHSYVAADLNEHFFDYAWLSPTRLMMVWSDHLGSEGNREQYDTWTGTAETLDMRTRRRRPLRGITKLFQHKNGVPWKFRLSPGGNWLEWTYGCTKDGWPFPAGARMDGSGFAQWSEDKFSETGWLDDHRWVEVGTRSSAGGEESDPVTVTDLARHSSGVLQRDSRAGQRIERRMLEMNGGDIYDGTGLEEPIEIDLGDTKVIAERHCALYEVSGSKVRAQNATIFQAHYSRRTLYAVQFAEAPPTHKGHRGRRFEALYVSGANGFHAREIGFVPAQQSGAYADSSAAQALTGVKWLPDDRRISFIFNRKLYVVKGW